MSSKRLLSIQEEMKRRRLLNRGQKKITNFMPKIASKPIETQPPKKQKSEKENSDIKLVEPTIPQ